MATVILLDEMKLIWKKLFRSESIKQIKPIKFQNIEKVASLILANMFVSNISNRDYVSLKLSLRIIN